MTKDNENAAALPPVHPSRTTAPAKTTPHPAGDWGVRNAVPGHGGSIKPADLKR
jgi:hypothetical protein